MSTRFLTPYATFLDSNGAPLVGGLLYFYETGSSTVAADTFSDVTLVTANTNPIVLNSRGEPSVDIFLDPSVTYRVVLKTSVGVTIWTADNVTDPAVGTDAAIAVYPGNPNGFVAGTEGSFGGVNSSMVYDSINDVIYVCTSTGDAGSAVWTSQTAGSAGLNAANVFTALPQTVRSTDAGASVGPFLVADWDSATPAASDEMIVLRALGEDSAGNDQTYADIAVIITDPTSGSEDARLRLGVVTAGTLAYEWEISGAALYPTTNDGASLGISGTAISDIFLATGAVLDFGTANLLMTHSAGIMTLSSAAAGVQLALTSTEAGAASGQVLELYRNSASPADGDEGPAIYFYGKDSGGTKTPFSSIRTSFPDITDGTEDGAMAFSIVTGGTFTDELYLTGTYLAPAASGGLSLGFGGQPFGNAFLTTVELGHASDTTLARASAGIVSVEGVNLVRANATDADTLLDTLGTETTGALLYHSGGVWAVLAPP